MQLWRVVTTDSRKCCVLMPFNLKCAVDRVTGSAEKLIFFSDITQIPNLRNSASFSVIGDRSGGRCVISSQQSFFESCAEGGDRIAMRVLLVTPGLCMLHICSYLCMLHRNRRSAPTAVCQGHLGPASSPLDELVL